jgi:transcriptional regulator GlxA family with amidase domain
MTRSTFVELAHRYVEQCAHNETPPRVVEFAASLERSERSLRVAWREDVGGAPGAFLRLSQLSIVKSLLLGTTMDLTQIAYRTGFGTRRSLFRAFRREIGIAPAQWRERHRAAATDQLSRPVR